MLTAVWLSALVQGDLSRKVSLTEPAIRSEVLVERLTESTGIRFLCAPETRGEVLIVKVQGVPLQDLLDKIAHVTGARWFWNAARDTLTLKRPPDLVKQQVEAHLQEARAATQQVFDRFIQGVDPKTPFDEKAAVSNLKERYRLHQSYSTNSAPTTWTKLVQQEHRLVGGRLLARALKGIDAGLVGSLEQGRLVFSSQPGPNEYALPDSTQLLTQFAKEHQTMIEAANGLPETHAVGIERLSGSTLYYTEHLRAMPTRLRVTFSRGYFANTEVFSEAGKCVFQAQVSLAGAYRGEPDPPSKVAESLPETIVAFRPESVLFDKAVFRRGSGVVPDAGMRSILLGPDLSDPLSFQVNDAVFALADALKKNVVASVPDVFALFTRADPRQSLRSVWTQWLYSVDLAQSDRWLVVWPKRLYSVRRARADRPALAEMMVSVARAGQANLDIRSRYAARLRYPRTWDFAPSYLRALLGQERSVSREEFAVARLYGNLSDAQRQTLKSGGTLLAGRLPPEAQIALEDWVFRAPNFRMNFAERHGAGMAYSSFRFECEPTAFFGKHVPADLALTGSYKVAPTVFSMSEDHGFTHPTNASSIAWNTVLVNYPERRTDDYVGAKAKYVMGTQTTLAIRVNAAENLFHTAALTDEEMPADAKPGDWTDLPPEIRAQVEKQIEWLLKQPLPAGKSNKGAPPP